METRHGVSLSVSDYVSPVKKLSFCSVQTDDGIFYCKEAKVRRGKEKRIPSAFLPLCPFAVKIIISPSS
jgi:hypothetical protein